MQQCYDSCYIIACHFFVRTGNDDPQYHARYIGVVVMIENINRNEYMY